ncbi:hypothetical protein [Streptomyces sp. BA2]|uniref:hypothetical protein n=1 Tax=Streptomyces sp. BA2 TaxID=436595 RepID=UPI00132BAADB|nr:hypothetical protein [Streptomyces sp. BA2]MWA16170.1 hypothetical protein [Streptomyces sp. BA2]
MLELLIVDCAYIEAAPAEQRAGLVESAAFGSDDARGPDLPEGWTWPEAQNGPWYARYEFRNTLTSYKPHFWAGERWEKMRGFVRPGLRTALDEFSAPLFWGEYNWESADPPFTPSVPGRENHWCPETMLWLLPEDVTALHHFWTLAEPGLPSLRQPFEQHLAGATGRVSTFSSFAALVTEWGEVVTEAAGRGWAIIGLKC